MEKVLFHHLNLNIKIMDTPKLIIQIPEPCHEDWNKMQTEATGKFCSSCSKSVIDFSNKTDIEIQKYFIEHRGQNICGRFKKTQVNRPLKITYHLKDLPKNVSITKAFAIAAFLAFGTFLFSCTDEQGKKIDAIEIYNSVEESHTLGEMMVPEPEISGENNFLSKNNTSVSHTKGEVDTVIDSVKEYSSDTTKYSIEKDSNFREYYITGLMESVLNDNISSNITDSTIINNTISESDQSIINTKINLTVFPNPSNGNFTIKYDVGKKTNVILDIFNEQGALVTNLVNIINQYEGKYQIPVNLIDFSNGVYFVNLIIGKERTTQKIIIEK